MNLGAETIRNFARSCLNSDLSRFIIVGAINTLLGALLMILFYNLTVLGYWGSSALSYILASLFSFFANKNFTFKSGVGYAKSAAKFVLNIAVCYIIAYLAAKPFIFYILKGFNADISNNIMEQIAMLVGILFFTVMNYFGQKFIVFK